MDRNYHREYSINYYHTRRAEYVKLLGGKCVLCSSKKLLEFDHINPATKSFNIGNMLAHSKKDVLAEVKKCRLLCKKCHKEVTDSNKTTPARLRARIIRKYQTGRFTQQQVADYYSVHQTTVSKFVNGTVGRAV